MSTVKEEITRISDILNKKVLGPVDLPIYYRGYLIKDTKKCILKNLMYLNKYYNQGDTSKTTTKGLLIYFGNLHFEYLIHLLKIHIYKQQITRNIELCDTVELINIFRKSCKILDYNSRNATSEIANFLHEFRGVRNQVIHIGSVYSFQHDNAYTKFNNFTGKQDTSSILYRDKSYENFINKYTRILGDAAPKVIDYNNSYVIEYMKLLRYTDLLLKDMEVKDDAFVSEYIDFLYTKLAYLTTNIKDGWLKPNDEDTFTYNEFRRLQRVGISKSLAKEIEKLKAFG